MRTEVTNAQYDRCVRAGVCTAPSNSVWRDVRFADHPVTDVSWDQASVYAQWVGGSLPTEAQWEKAARGTDLRAYPWGDQEPTVSLLNFEGSGIGGTSAVGSYPIGASPYGALDMAGNVWEWVADWYDGSYYSVSPVENPQGPATGSYRVLRGGSWYGSASSCAPPSGTAATPASGTTTAGSGVSARFDPGLLGSALLGFWKGGSAAMGAKPPLSAPAKPAEIF
jgi:formylglycine-generating enzyme required for sulfatase activity